MTAFYIAPYNPINWTTTKSDLKIDPIWYKERLSDDWLRVKFYSPSKTASLAWDLPVSEYGAFIYGFLHTNFQIISLDTPYEEFFLWHRKIISDKYKLYLFNDSSSDSLELTFHTTIENIRQFCGESPR